MSGEQTEGRASGSEPWTNFDSMPIAAMRIANGAVVGVNAAYERLTSLSAADIVGRSVPELVASFVVDDDIPMMHGAAAQPLVQGGGGEVWCRVTDTRGVKRTVRVVWRAGDPTRPDEHFVFLIPADVDAFEREFAERLAVAAAGMLRCEDEDEVLALAADAVAAQGYTVTMLLLREDDPFLAYGPTRSARSDGKDHAFESVRPSREILTRFNPRFHERKAAFFQRPAVLVREAYPTEMAQSLERRLPGTRTVQAPLFVADRPYGAIVVTDDRLTHVSVGTLEMFAQLVGAAIENAQLHQRATARLHDLERLQDELVQRERLVALGEAAAVMAHEVRNPIGTILNAVTLLERESTPGLSTKDLHRIIAEEAGRLERLVRDLLALGRPLTPRLRAVDLAAVAENVLGIVRTRGEDEACVLDPIDTDGVLAIADPELVELALLNVVRNAIQASPPHGHVRVEIHADRDAGVALAVEDQGPGVSDEIARKILEPFFTTKPTGTGIGLAVVRRMLDANHATLRIERAASGGARVVMQFPKAPNADVPAA